MDNSESELAVVVIGEDPYTEFFGDKDNLDLLSEDIQTINNLNQLELRSSKSTLDSFNLVEHSSK